MNKCTTKPWNLKRWVVIIQPGNPVNHRDNLQYPAILRMASVGCWAVDFGACLFHVISKDLKGDQCMTRWFSVLQWICSFLSDHIWNLEYWINYI